MPRRSCGWWSPTRSCGRTSPTSHSSRRRPTPPACGPGWNRRSSVPRCANGWPVRRWVSPRPSGLTMPTSTSDTTSGTCRCRRRGRAPAARPGSTTGGHAARPGPAAVGAHRGGRPGRRALRRAAAPPPHPDGRGGGMKLSAPAGADSAAGGRTGRPVAAVGARPAGVAASRDPLPGRDGGSAGRVARAHGRRATAPGASSSGSPAGSVTLFGPGLPVRPGDDRRPQGLGPGRHPADFDR